MVFWQIGEVEVDPVVGGITEQEGLAIHGDCVLGLGHILKWWELWWIVVDFIRWCDGIVQVQPPLVVDLFACGCVFSDSAFKAEHESWCLSWLPVGFDVVGCELDVDGVLVVVPLGCVVLLADGLTCGKVSDFEGLLVNGEVFIVGIGESYTVDAVGEVAGNVWLGEELVFHFLPWEDGLSVNGFLGASLGGFGDDILFHGRNVSADAWLVGGKNVIVELFTSGIGELVSVLTILVGVGAEREFVTFGNVEVFTDLGGSLPVGVVDDTGDQECDLEGLVELL